MRSIKKVGHQFAMRREAKFHLLCDMRLRRDPSAIAEEGCDGIVHVTLRVGSVEDTGLSLYPH